MSPTSRPLSSKMESLAKEGIKKIEWSSAQTFPEPNSVVGGRIYDALINGSPEELVRLTRDVAYIKACISEPDTVDQLVSTVWGETAAAIARLPATAEKGLAEVLAAISSTGVHNSENIREWMAVWLGSKWSTYGHWYTDRLPSLLKLYQEDIQAEIKQPLSISDLILTEDGEITRNAKTMLRELADAVGKNADDPIPEKDRFIQLLKELLDPNTNTTTWRENRARERNESTAPLARITVTDSGEGGVFCVFYESQIQKTRLLNQLVPNYAFVEETNAS